MSAGDPHWTRVVKRSLAVSVEPDWIAHDTTHVEQMPEHHLGKHDTALHAQWTLRQSVTF